MCDLGFRQENHFYENCSDKHPLELPTMYWIGEEYVPYQYITQCARLHVRVDSVRACACVHMCANGVNSDYVYTVRVLYVSDSLLLLHK